MLTTSDFQHARCNYFYRHATYLSAVYVDKLDKYVTRNFFMLIDMLDKYIDTQLFYVDMLEKYVDISMQLSIDLNIYFIV